MTLILSAARTPIGSFQGTLAAIPAPRLAASSIRAAIARAGLENAAVSDVILGQVIQGGTGQAPARQAALFAGLSPATRCSTVNKVCASSLEAVILGTRSLALGDATCVIAGGMESMSSAPYYLPQARKGYRLGHQEVKDAVITDALWDPHENLHMGGCAEHCATKYAISRQDQDDYAAESFRRANQAQADGCFAAEISAFEDKTPKGETVTLKEDEGPKRVNYDKIPQLKPAFAKDGTITAANASTLNDGAAVVILAKDASSTGSSVKPLARIASYGSHSQDPLWFTTAPVEAARTAISRAGWKVEDVDLWEVNEAFAVVPIAFACAFGIPSEKLNVWGGAISLGHPVGASGARILITLIHALRARGVRRGVAAICAGGGDGVAVCVEITE